MFLKKTVFSTFYCGISQIGISKMRHLIYFYSLKKSSFHLTAKEEVGRVVGQQYRNVLAAIKGRTIDNLNGSPLCYGNSFYNVPFKGLSFRILNILPLKSLDV
ncbi:unnamed protein product [Rangifer tarandus platyrhynchus]|uniref:Uncharacterized protein n=2 Tax=Rangifer tarandus platyrhynchus TaxID=3082113 RepID=A0AC60A0D3_RANTA|nr:unnamed protein product [Rangifer tarandus platyrhynchus]